MMPAVLSTVRSGPTLWVVQMVYIAQEDRWTVLRASGDLVRSVVRWVGRQSRQVVEVNHKLLVLRLLVQALGPSVVGENELHFGL